ncbi:hypothetical protein PRNP1_001163 [Phytophthora ramorum]
MPFARLARFFSFGLFRRRRRRDGAAQRRRQLRESARVHGITTVKAVVEVSDMEAASVEFDMCSNRSPPASLNSIRNGVRTERLGQDPTEVSMRSIRSFRAVGHVDLVKNDQRKLRKALKRAVKQERKEARKMKKLAEKNKKGAVNQGTSSNHIALLSAGSVSDCSETSDQDILAEIWAMRSPSLSHGSIEDMPEVDDELPQEPMEFLFFTGCPDDKNVHGCRRYLPAVSYATSCHT